MSKKEEKKEENEIDKNIKKSHKSFKSIMKRRGIYKRVRGSLKKRKFAELRLKIYGIIAISISMMFLFVMFYKIFSKGYTAFFQTEILLQLDLKKEKIDTNNYRSIIADALISIFPEVKENRDIRDLNALISRSASSNLKKLVKNNPSLVGTKQKIWLLASSDVDMIIKGYVKYSNTSVLSNQYSKKISRIERLQSKNLVRKAFNSLFFMYGDSRAPESAGILGSFVGSVLMVLTCVIVAFPLGVLTALYLEEFAPSNKITNFIEININNLTAVPSVVYGILGLMIYLQFFSFPRSSSIVGGLTLAMMLLPIIVVTTRTAISTVPKYIKEGAYALGATKLQVIMHHVIPYSMPGIMTGMILGVSRVLGETAPLLMIGMIAFIVDIPTGITDPATALPAQIFLWSDTPEPGFIEKTSAAIIVLLLFLFLINSLSVYLRKKFERKG